MSQTLGEKLRQAREERGISVSEVAEQTRISPLYIDSIEKDDYKPLPGGIFNKGFVKSYAKFIGIDEYEALHDYAAIVTKNEGGSEADLRAYRPEVLTDDSSSSMVPTIIFAGIILALMTGGILFGIRYLQGRGDEPSTAVNSRPANAGLNSNAGLPAADQASDAVPAMETLKAEFTASTVEISLSSVTDGKNSVALVSGGSSVTFEPKQALKLAYSKDRAESARLKLNGKPIELPVNPAVPTRRTIEIEINKDNLAAIWQSGRISFESETASATPEAVPTEAPETAPPAATPAPEQTPERTATPRPAAPRTPRPATPQPLPTRRVIVVGNSNRPG